MRYPNALVYVTITQAMCADNYSNKIIPFNTYSIHTHAHKCILYMKAIYRTNHFNQYRVHALTHFQLASLFNFLLLLFSSAFSSIFIYFLLIAIAATLRSFNLHMYVRRQLTISCIFPLYRRRASDAT